MKSPLLEVIDFLKTLALTRLLPHIFLKVFRELNAHASNLVLVLLFVISGCTLPFPPLAAELNGELGRAIDMGFDGIIVHVNQAGKSASYSSGWNVRVNLTPANPNALFKIASISKLYVAAAAKMLVSEGTLSMDGTLAEYLPDVATRIEHSSAITLNLLIQHRSGIPDFIYHPDIYGANIVENDDTYPFVLDQPADFIPGSRYGYSNSNYFLIGEILDSVLEAGHHQYIREKILSPLALNNTYSLLRDVDINKVMKGYVIGVNDGDVFWKWEHVQPSGSMVASAQDVATFAKTLVDGTLFTAQQQSIYSSVYEYEHTGWLPGYSSIVRYHSDINAVVVMFVNTSFDQLFWLDLERVYDRVVAVLERNPL